MIGKSGYLSYCSADIELRQRIKVALWHNLGEYFLDVTSGVPWNDAILGRKDNGGVVSNELRRAILRVDGVARIETFSAAIDGETGLWQVKARIVTVLSTMFMFEFTEGNPYA